MGNYKFYTPPMLAECLISLLPDREYHNIIDICCGSWNLLEAANEQFAAASYVGVDIDSDAKKNCFSGAKFFCKDGRRFALEEKKKYDLILSNPPFGYLQEEERVFNDVKESSLFIKALINKRYENEMMQANLLLTRKNGVLLFILPMTFLNGNTYHLIRKELCQKYTIDSIIKLPIETFGNRKISTFALIMINSGMQKKETKLQEIICENGKWKAKYICDISQKRMMEGAWEEVVETGREKKDLTLFRGNISSSQMSKSGTKVFHCSSIIRDGLWEPSIRYCDDEVIVKNAKVVMPGDIIINRVGRYANYWCVCTDKGIISDCLIAIKKSDKYNVYEQLVKNSTNGKLNINTKGVTTKYVTISDIWNLL